MSEETKDVAEVKIVAGVKIGDGVSRPIIISDAGATGDNISATGAISSATTTATAIDMIRSSDERERRLNLSAFRKAGSGWPTPRVIFVEGEIGAGKSTILQVLKQDFEKRGHIVALTFEPVALWRETGALERMYADKRNLYEFQTFTFATRVTAMRDTFAAMDPATTVWLVERSVLTDRHIFMYVQDALVDECQKKMYAQWCDLHQLLLPVSLADAFVLYIKPSLDMCMERVRARARAEEIRETGEKKTGGVTMDLQRSLRHAHERFFESADGVIPARPFSRDAVYVVEGEHADGDFKSSGPITHAIVERLSKMMIDQTAKRLSITRDKFRAIAGGVYHCAPSKSDPPPHASAGPA